MSCLFCKIINREIPASIVYEDDEVLAFTRAHFVDDAVPMFEFQCHAGRAGFVFVLALASLACLAQAQPPERWLVPACDAISSVYVAAAIGTGVAFVALSLLNPAGWLGRLIAGTIAGAVLVLVVVALRMGEWHELTRLGKMPRSDAVVLVATFSLTVLFDLVVAVEVGMMLAAVLFIKRMAETTEIARVTASDELETPEQLAHGKDIPEGVVVYRIFGPFFFGAAEKMEDALLRAGTLPRVLILRMQLVPAMDATALNALESIVERMQAAGGTVILSGPHRQPLEMMMKAGFIERLGRRNIRAHFDDALVRARELLAAPAPLKPPAT